MALHRWFGTTALADLLVDERRALYRGLDGLLEHKDALFAHLRQRWSDLFGAKFDMLLYDLTLTYFECDVADGRTDPRRFGYSRDKRSDCVQVIVALVVTPEGLPLAYEMFPGNTADKRTLRNMVQLIQTRPNQAQLSGGHAQRPVDQAGKRTGTRVNIKPPAKFEIPTFQDLWLFLRTAVPAQNTYDATAKWDKKQCPRNHSRRFRDGCSVTRCRRRRGKKE